MEVPLEWLLTSAAPSLQYRAIRQFLPVEYRPARLEALTYTSMSCRLAVAQQADGVWNGTMLQVPEAGVRVPAAHVGTTAAVHRLLELGWDEGSPPVTNARRPLFRLLAEDADPAFAYELRSAGQEPETVSWSRAILRGAAAAALAHSGYERDPRLRGAAMRLLKRVDEFLRSPLAEDPWVKQGGGHVLSADAVPPSLHFFLMLAFMPEFRNEHDDFIDRVVEYCRRPLPRYASAQVVGARVLPSPYLVLGDPLTSRASVDGDIPFALLWLEVAARLGILDRHEGWKQQFDRLLDDRDRDFVWRPGKGQSVVTTRDVAWPFADLQGRGPEGAAAEVTFRLGLIGTIAGRPLEYV